MAEEGVERLWSLENSAVKVSPGNGRYTWVPVIYMGLNGLFPLLGSLRRFLCAAQAGLTPPVLPPQPPEC